VIWKGPQTSFSQRNLRSHWEEASQRHVRHSSDTASPPGHRSVKTNEVLWDIAARISKGRLSRASELTEQLTQLVTLGPGTPTTLTEDFRRFPQSCQADFGIVP
jgi:hypothetical protein